MTAEREAMTERQAFEKWYVEHAFDYDCAKLGSRDSALQWAAWQAAIAALSRTAEPVSAFFDKHALGTKLAPSCFGCGAAWTTWDGCTRHLELPNVYLCPQCAARCKDTHPPEPARDAKDAARYRWLRDHIDEREVISLRLVVPDGDEAESARVDAVVDAAMAQESGDGK